MNWKCKISSLIELEPQKARVYFLANLKTGLSLEDLLEKDYSEVLKLQKSPINMEIQTLLELRASVDAAFQDSQLHKIDSVSALNAIEVAQSAYFDAILAANHAIYTATSSKKKAINDMLLENCSGSVDEEAEITQIRNKKPKWLVTSPKSKLPRKKVV